METKRKIENTRELSDASKNIIMAYNTLEDLSRVNACWLSMLEFIAVGVKLLVFSTADLVKMTE